MTTSPLTHPLLRRGIADQRLHKHMAFHVLVQLVELIPTPGVVKVETVATVLCLDKRTVRRALALLVRANYIGCLRRGRARVAGEYELITAHRGTPCPVASSDPLPEMAKAA